MHHHDEYDDDHLANNYTQMTTDDDEAKINLEEEANYQRLLASYNKGDEEGTLCCFGQFLKEYWPYLLGLLSVCSGIGCVASNKSSDTVKIIGAGLIIIPILIGAYCCVPSCRSASVETEENENAYSPRAQ
jgi:hypothetical protein